LTAHQNRQEAVAGFLPFSFLPIDKPPKICYNFWQKQKRGRIILPATKQPQRKPAASGKKPAAKKPAKPAGQKKGKKLSAKAMEEARHRALMLHAWFLGFFTLLVLALGVFPGQDAWLSAHNGLWAFAGMTLLPWLLLSAYCCSLWVRGRSLKENWPALLFQALLILSFGAAVFLFSHSKEELGAAPWQALATGMFVQYTGAVPAAEILRNGGLFGAMLGAGLAKACGKSVAAVISLIFMAASLPLALPKLREYLAGLAAGRWGAGAPPRPEKEKAEKSAPAQREKTRRIPIGDELEELDRIEREHGGGQRRGMFGGLRERFTGEPRQPANTPAAAVPHTVVDIEPLRPADDRAAGELAQNLADEAEAPGGAKRKKARQAGEEAARAAMEAQLSNAMAMPGHSEATEPHRRCYEAPPLSCLNPPRATGAAPERGEEDMIARKLVYTLESFGVAVELVGRSRGPAVTRYELRPAEGVKISKITSLSDDIALRLAATKVRIEAPIPGKPAVGVEVPNRVRAVVTLRELVDSDIYRAGVKKSVLTVALGKDIVGDLVTADLARLPHLLIAGTTGSGKSVCMNALIMSLMYNASPDEVKLIMVDPKQVEFTVYSGIPHLLVPVVTDPLKAAGALGWAVSEMDKRYGRISEQNVRDIDSYNNIAAMQDDLEHMPRVVVFIDELADLMMVAPSDVEDSIQRLTQKGRAAGIHLVVATQRPSVDVITGVIKSNLPGRIALSVASQIDSRTIINSAGAEQLLGNGDMLFSVNGGNNAVRVQGCYVSDPELKKVVDFVKDKDASEGYDDGVWEEIDRFAAATARGKKRGGGIELPGEEDGDEDPMLDAAIHVVVNKQLASTTMLQKELKLGYARASRIVDQIEARGIIGPPEGAKAR